MNVFRQLLAALRLLVALTVLLGLAYPLVMLGVGQLTFHARANGSLVHVDGEVVGSKLLGQSFSGPQWFHPRPSAAGSTGYDALASGGSNLGPTSTKLDDLISQRRATISAEDGVPAGSVPPDALTASGSGLDPDISPAYAYEQIDRVARARGLPTATVHALVTAHVTNRALGFLGEPHVNVLVLNVALAKLGG